MKIAFWKIFLIQFGLLLLNSFISIFPFQMITGNGGERGVISVLGILYTFILFIIDFSFYLAYLKIPRLIPLVIFPFVAGLPFIYFTYDGFNEIMVLDLILLLINTGAGLILYFNFEKKPEPTV